MVIAALMQGLRAMIALVLAIVLACAPPINVVAHNPAVLAAFEAERHAALGMTDSSTHGHDHEHSHDDADPEERQPGHAHGHNPTDHSHDTGQLGLAAPGLGIPPRTRLNPLPSVQADDGLRHRLERPPRALS